MMQSDPKFYLQYFCRSITEAASPDFDCEVVSLDDANNDCASEDVARLEMPEGFFALIGPNKSKPATTSLYKCLLGCIVGKILSCANNSRHNLRRHIKVHWVLDCWLLALIFVPEGFRHCRSGKRPKPNSILRVKRLL